jgi:hypothetical protein
MAEPKTTTEAQPEAEPEAKVPTPTPEQLADPSYHQSAADKPVEERWPIPRPREPDPAIKQPGEGETAPPAAPKSESSDSS